MSDIITQLPDSVANQIAAGEVIQRPASIVKELVENSLDAGASRIQIFITDAGKTCVQVIDDGKGMSETDARLSFERHATSKIRQAEDLYALTTMGFRGEALPSIAAVAEVELRTRQEEDELGTCITISGGSRPHQEPIACPVGANFIIKNLFYNIPARRKFLKSDKTELTNILVEFHRIVLAHPEVSFCLTAQNNVLLDLPKGSFKQRIDNVFNKHRLEKQLLSVQVETPLVQVAGFVGTPESSKKTNVPQFFFVNGRYMRHPFFAKAVQTAYERLIPDGEQCPFFLHLVVDPSKIDVNIHPTKTEIKFEDERSIWQILLAAIREALGKFNAIPTIDFDTTNRPEIPIFNDDPFAVKAPVIHYNNDFNPFEQKGSNLQQVKRTPLPPVVHGEKPAYTFVDSPSTSVLTSQDSQESLLPSSIGTGAAVGVLFERTEIESRDFSTADFLQYHGRYLLTPTDEGLLLIDAPRAHTRILYEEYMEKAAAKKIETQRLLFPLLVELDTIKSALYETMADDIATLGFDISPLGGGAYSILGVPSNIEGLDPTHLLNVIIDDASEKSVEVREELLHSAALSLARRTAIPSDQILSLDEMRDLASRLFKSSNPNVTPDGKVVVSLLPDNVLLTKF